MTPPLRGPSDQPYIGPWVHAAALEAWGREAQFRALMEELCEAAAAVSRLLNGKAHEGQVLEELVDVASLQASLYYELGTETMWEAMRQKKRAKLLAKLPHGTQAEQQAVDLGAAIGRVQP